MQNSQFHCIYWMCSLELWKINPWEFVGFPPLILPIIHQNYSWTCRKTSVGILLFSWIAIICMWNSRSSPKKFEYKSSYLKEQVHWDNLPRFVQAGVGLAAASFSSHFLTPPVLAWSCVWVCLTQVCSRTEETWTNPNSQLALEIRLFWQSFHMVCFLAFCILFPLLKGSLFWSHPQSLHSHHLVKFKHLFF